MVDIPLIKKVAIQPIQQRIPAVNGDKTLSFALHGAINNIVKALANTTNNNADTLQLVIDALANIGVVVKRVDDLEAAQAKAAPEQALVNSYTDPTYVLSSMTEIGGTTASITVSNHNRVYADAAKTTVAVTGKTFTGLALNSNYYLYYDDASRAGGAVDIKYSTDNLDAAQTGIRHSLGSIQTPGEDATEPVEGGGVSPPGGSRVPPYKRLQTDDGDSPYK